MVPGNGWGRSRSGKQREDNQVEQRLFRRAPSLLSRRRLREFHDGGRRRASESDLRQQLQTSGPDQSEIRSDESVSGKSEHQTERNKARRLIDERVGTEIVTGADQGAVPQRTTSGDDHPSGERKNRRWRDLQRRDR